VTPGRSPPFALYLVTDDAYLDGQFVDKIRAALDGGVSWLEPQQLATLAWAMARLGHRDEGTLREVAAAAKKEKDKAKAAAAKMKAKTSGTPKKARA